MGAAGHTLWLRALVLLGIIGFAFFLAWERGFVTLTLESDRSYLSYIILLVYAGATLHWVWVAWQLSRERGVVAGLDEGCVAGLRSDNGRLIGPSGEVPPGDVSRYFAAALSADTSARGALLTVLSDRVLNRHAAGHFVADTLLKLGLLGTIVGFILMLLPVAELTDFEPAMMQRLLGQMSQGMAVALYTTLAGLVTSTLLKLQYQVLDGSAAALVTRVQELSEVALDRSPDNAAPSR